MKVAPSPLALEQARVPAQQHEAMIETLGRAVLANPRDPRALGTYQRLLDRLPDGAHGYNDLAMALDALGYPDRAEACFCRAIALEPGDPRFHHNLGRLLGTRGRTHDAVGCYRQALRLDPDYANAHWNLALALLSLGHYEEGWTHFAWRTRARLGAILESQRRAENPWRGEALHGQCLLVRYEQGLGDLIQLVRFLPQVRARGARVLLETPAPLARLCAGLDGVDALVEARADGSPAVAHDRHVFAFDLPGILGTTLESLPGPIPYLRCDPALRATWQRRLAGPAFKIGVVWAGSPRHRNDAQRSCPVHCLRALTAVRGVQVFSLQKGPGAASLRQVHTHRVVDLAPTIHDFADTAAIVDVLDLVLSVDTAVLHLAGALGRPAWGLLPHVSDWRWLQNRSDSPWYPSLRLFRQPRPGDWDGVFAAVTEALQRNLPRP